MQFSRPRHATATNLRHWAPDPIATTVVLSSVVVQGQQPTLGPDGSALVRAIARYSDGSEKDVTAEATWTSSQVGIATVAAGIITGQALGRVTISARYESGSSALRMAIQPAGTFVLSGNITEPGPFNVAEATVAIVGGSYQVTSTSTGSYEMFGMSGAVTLRVSKQGYDDETRTLTVTEDQTLNLELRPAIAPISIAGDYRVTVTIPPSCGFPHEHTTRTYNATIEQTGARHQS